MKRNWLATRNVRKFLRHRSAVVALGFVVFYVLLAGAVLLFGLVTVEETEMRVGPGTLPGFFLQQLPEERFENCRMYLDQLTPTGRERLLPADELNRVIERKAKNFRFGNLTVADEPVAALQKKVDAANRLYAQLATTDDLNEQPDILPRLDQLELQVAELFPYPTGWAGFERTFRLLLGTDRQGRSISLRAIYSVKVALQVGIVTSLISVLFGSLLGAAAAFFASWVDHLVIWLYTTFSSVPNLVLLVVLAYAFSGGRFENTLVPVYVAFCATFWIGPCRVVRGETMKLKELEYVQAAKAIGFGRFYVMLRHILPNVSHLMLINFSLLLIAAIKSEVILSYLGLGTKNASWGIMISQSGPEVINGHFWQIGTATAFMFVLVLAINVVSDTLQDVFDPKHL